MALKDLKNRAEAAQISALLDVCEAHGIEALPVNHHDCEQAQGKARGVWLIGNLTSDARELIAETPITQLDFYAARDRRHLGSVTLEHGLGPDLHLIAATPNATTMDILARAGIEVQPAMICAPSPEDVSYLTTFESLVCLSRYLRHKASTKAYEVRHAIEGVTYELDRLNDMIVGMVEGAVRAEVPLPRGHDSFLNSVAAQIVDRARKKLDDVFPAVNSATTALMCITPPPVAALSVLGEKGAEDDR